MEQSQEEFLDNWRRHFLFLESYDIERLKTSLKKFDGEASELNIGEGAVNGLMVDIFDAYYDSGHRDCASLIAKHYEPLPRSRLVRYIPCSC